MIYSLRDGIPPREIEEKPKETKPKKTKPLPKPPKKTRKKR